MLPHHDPEALLPCGDPVALLPSCPVTTNELQEFCCREMLTSVAVLDEMLPGRTDNEIKNYWNTRLKRHQRAGLPIYPEYLLSRVPDQDMNCHTPDESRGKKRSNELPQEKVVGMDDLVGDFMVFQHLDYGKDPVVPTNPLKRHASTGDLSCLQIPVNTEKTFYSNDLYYVLTKSQSMPLGSAIASGYPIFDGNLSTSGTIHGSMKTELPSFQSSKCDFSNGWLLQCPSASIEQQIDTFIQSPESMSSHNTGLLGRIINKGDVLDDPTKSERFFEMAVPLGYNIVSKSNDYPMRHPSSSVNGDCEPDACLFPETQDSNSPSGGSDAIFTLGKCYPDGNFPVAGMPSLEASFFNADSLLKDQSYLYPSGSLFDEEPCEEPKPLIDAGQWLDSTVWKSVPGASNMPDFTGP
ncbi:transcription factor GAMYB-like [Panicum miliaceum]|uniref:Transcription factor GAMYB-like n=1 Tax=Panicum miliaceum TaxID=4540 RepID=A0A3L6S4D8_PANMI|nr:transcription factor GAMYB-like [Panicum miliaceum]